LRAFEAAARTGSFAGAAEELSVTRPAVSKQIRVLEDQLGCELFERTHGSTTLTVSGTDLYAGLAQSFDLISETVDRVRGRAAGRDTLRLLVEQDFASAWLAGTIGRFLVDHPGVSVDVVAERNDVLRMDEDYNYRIVYANPDEPGGNLQMLEGRELCRWVDFPLCAPDYLQAPAESPATVLAEAHLLHDRTARPWRDWLEGADIREEVGLEHGTVFNETSLCLSAAMAHAGIAIGDTFLAFPHLREGTLVPPFPLGLRSSEAYMLYRRPGVERSPAERAFEEWLVGAVGTYTDELERFLSRMAVRIAT
jgi:DNA-binding transcriptional LysR family regulator